MKGNNRAKRFGASRPAISWFDAFAMKIAESHNDPEPPHAELVEARSALGAALIAAGDLILRQAQDEGCRFGAKDRAHARLT